MILINKTHLVIVSLINLTLILKLISVVWSGNDKAIIIMIFGYTILMIANVIVWLVLVFLKRPEFKIFKMTTTGLAILFIPTLIVSSLY